MKNRVKKIMSDILSIDVNSINNNASPDNIEKWDSLKHMDLIVSLEEEFGIEFTDDEIVDSMNYALIVNILETKQM
jgi:acyl carrier protein